jgi:ornithine cyclodeaminase/alanine dehydrogenase-like protein (mu-crystallin family)
MTLVLDEAEVRQALDMQGAIEAMEALCREEAADETLSADRIHLRLPRGFMRILPGVLTRSGVMGYKAFHVTGQGVRYAVYLFDLESGAPLAMMDANYITAIRTGAMAAVALKYLSPPHATRVGVIGSGMEARSEMAALMAVRPAIRHGRVFSPRAERREAFAREIADMHGIEMFAVDRPQYAVADADILLVATGTRGGGVALEGAWLQAGLHVNSIGSTAPEQREIDPLVWQRADRIVLDTLRLLHESGDALAAEQAHTLDRSRIVELNKVVAGEAAGRTSAEQTTLYKSVGTGLQDLAAAHRIYLAARERGLGTQIADFQTARVPGR